MADNVFNLDEGLVEYFEFIVCGHRYKFRYPNTEELDTLRSIGSDEQKAKDFMFGFIDPIGDSPTFEEVQKKMLVTQWVKFREMIDTQMTKNNG